MKEKKITKINLRRSVAASKLPFRPIASVDAVDDAKLATGVVRLVVASSKVDLMVVGDHVVVNDDVDNDNVDVDNVDNVTAEISVVLVNNNNSKIITVLCKYLLNLLLLQQLLVLLQLLSQFSCCRFALLLCTLM